MEVKNRFTPDGSKPMKQSTETKVQQSHAEAADINNIVKRFKRTGLATTGNVSVSQTVPVFGAYPHMDYTEMYQHVQDVKQQFMALPSRIRGRFDNNPANLIRWIEDPKNAQEAVKLGLMNLPEGFNFDEKGQLVEQIDLVNESRKAGDSKESKPVVTKPLDVMVTTDTTK